MFLISCFICLLVDVMIVALRVPLLDDSLEWILCLEKLVLPKFTSAFDTAILKTKTKFGFSSPNFFLDFVKFTEDFVRNCFPHHLTYSNRFRKRITKNKTLNSALFLLLREITIFKIVL